MQAINYLYQEKKRLENEMYDSLLFDDPVSVLESIANKLEKVEQQIEDLEFDNMVDDK